MKVSSSYIYVDIYEYVWVVCVEKIRENEKIIKKKGENIWDNFEKKKSGKFSKCWKKVNEGYKNCWQKDWKGEKKYSRKGVGLSRNLALRVYTKLQSHALIFPFRTGKQRCGKGSPCHEEWPCQI